MRQNLSLRRTGAILALVIFMTTLLTGPVVSGQVEPPVPAEPAGPTEPVVVRLYYQDRGHLDAVAGQLDIWEVHQAKGYVVALVRPDEYRWLADLDYRLEIDGAKTRSAHLQAPLDPRFHYYDDFYTNPNGLYVVDFLQDVQTNYPGLTELIDIGDAWLAGQPGEHDRDILVLRITNEDPAYGNIADKPAFFLFATIHAREVAVPELTIRYIKYLTEGWDGEGGYGLDPDATWLVNHNVVYLLVMQNPDGHWVNEQNTSAYRRKNMDDDDGCGDPNSWGTDLNRNHSFFWGCCGGSSGNPCSETYRGPGRGSEPETQAFENYFGTVMRDQNGPNDDTTIPPAAPITATGIFISLHSYSDLILWPWGFQANPAPNGADMRTIGRKLATFNNYTPQQAHDLYTVDGSTDDWTYGKFGLASFTYEVGSSWGVCGGFFPDYECIDGTGGATRDFWAENGPSFIYAHKIARTPYVTAYGPDTEDPVVTPDEVPQGAPVDLSATITDDRYGSDPLRPVAGAEYFIDAPGDDGSGTPMSPSDGSWGETTEGVEGVVDTTGLAPGQHYILVHGQNNNGDWGPFTAVFVTTTIGLDPETISLEAAPLSIPIVHGQATVTATLALSDSTPVPGQLVTFSTDLGALDPPTARSDGNGHAVTTLSAGAVTGTARVSAQTAALTHTPWVSLTLYVPAAPTAGFVHNSPVCTGTAVVFGNTSTYPPEVPVAYLWQFGDGMTSTLESPQHVYPGLGPYTVSLSASNVGGQDLFSDVVGLVPWPQADFDYTPALPQPGQPVQFYDASSGEPDAWDWAFGDGGSAGVQDPLHAYAAEGSYTVTLRAHNLCGWSPAFAQPLTVLEPSAWSWDKWVAGQAWTEGLSLNLETADQFEVTDVLSSQRAYTLTEVWDEAHLTLIDYQLLPPGTGQVISDDGSLILGLTAGTSGPVTLTKWFGVQPCTWTQSLLAESLAVDGVEVAQRPVVLNKLPPELWLNSQSGPVVAPGQTATFTWLYSNTGGLENDVMVRGEFPAQAPYASASPTPTRAAADGRWAEWELGDLALGQQGGLTVTVAVTEAVGHGEAITITGRLYDHTGGVADQTQVLYQVGCVGLEAVDVDGPSSGQPGVYTFTTSYQPPDASPPINYTWDDGGTAATSVRELDVGTHTLTLTATNCAAGGSGVTVTGSHTVVVQSASVCTPLAGVELSLLTPGTLYLGAELTFSADLAPDGASKPYSYTLNYGDGTVLLPARSSQDPLVFSHTYSAEGRYTLVVSAWNCDMTVPVSDTLSIEVAAGSYRLYLPIVIKND